MCVLPVWLRPKQSIVSSYRQRTQQSTIEFLNCSPACAKKCSFVVLEIWSKLLQNFANGSLIHILINHSPSIIGSASFRWKGRAIRSWLLSISLTIFIHHPAASTSCRCVMSDATQSSSGSCQLTIDVYQAPICFVVVLSSSFSFIADSPNRDQLIVVSDW